jgi:hypothetical protein
MANGVFGQFGGSTTTSAAHQQLERQRGFQERRTLQQQQQGQMQQLAMQLGVQSPMSTQVGTQRFQGAVGGQADALQRILGSAGGLQGLMSQYNAFIEGISPETSQRAADISQAFKEREASIQQRLHRSGLAGSTGAISSAGLGVEREKQAALNRLSEGMEGQKFAAMQAKTGLLGGLLGQFGQATGSLDQAYQLSQLAEAIAPGSGQPVRIPPPEGLPRQPRGRSGLIRGGIL